jgi:hypothetical protein
MCKAFRKDIFRKLKEWKKSPTESISSLKAMRGSRQQVPDYAEDEEVLDTFELVDKVTKQLKKDGISIAQLSRMLNIYVGEIKKLIHFPVPWILLTNLKKEYYRKLNEWLLENEDEEDDPYFSTSVEEGDEEIDTFKVSRDIIQLLKSHAISHNFFAQLTLKISPVYFGELVTNTKPWNDLHKSQRKIFKIIETWTRAKPEEIKAFKQKNLVHNAKIAISIQNLKIKKAFNQ